MKLTEDQKDSLGQVLEHDGTKVVFALLEYMAKNIEAEVVALKVSAETLPELGYRKARSEGAWSLLRQFNSFLEERRR